MYQLRCVLQQRKQCGLQDAGLIGGQALPQGQQEHEKVCGTPQTNKRLFQQCPVLLCSLCQCHYLEETGAGKSLLIITRITIVYRGDDDAFIHQQFAIFTTARLHAILNHINATMVFLKVKAIQCEHFAFKEL